MTIKTILWDIDGTILDFKSAEKVALKKVFKAFGYGECSDLQIQLYSDINTQYWQRLEKGEIQKSVLLVERFKSFFEQIGVETERTAEFNEAYLHALPDTIVFMPHALEVLQKLHEMYRQYIVTNGIRDVQLKKIANAEIAVYFDDIFISGDIGHEKPRIEFFQAVFEQTGIRDSEEVMIIGDSLTGDMLGGIQAGIHTCWYNPCHMRMHENIRPEYEVSSHDQFYKLIMDNQSNGENLS